MIDGVPLVDAHVHVAHLARLKVDGRAWGAGFHGDRPFTELYDEAGAIRPDALDAYLGAEGVDVALLMSEYSPRVTGWQQIEDLRPLVEHNPGRFKLVAAVNPHVHHPVRAELDRQLAMGAVALKIHPVHGGFSPTEPALYPAYQRCEDEGIPVVFHCGTSTFAGASNAYADPLLLDGVVRDFPGLTVVLAHGGRGWWYDAAAFLALAHDRVWIELSGLPPRRLPAYYRRHDLHRLAAKFIFGSDWPGVPSIAANARAVAALDLPAECLAGVLHGNAGVVYPGLSVPG